MERFLNALLLQQGLPYVWGGKGLPGGVPGRDCSGTVSVALRDAGDIVDRRRDWNANRYWTDLPRTTTPEPGDFCLYGSPDRASHIMVLMPDGKVFGAAGGNSNTTNAAEAKKIGASVKWRRGPDYRPDLLGYVRNPLRPK